MREHLDTDRSPAWREVADAREGTIFHDWTDGELRALVGRGGFSLCAYVGVPLGGELSGHDYNAVPIDCHGGLTFSEAGGKHPFPAGYWWYGWDYSHLEDRSVSRTTPRYYINDGHPWTVEEVRLEVIAALAQFKRLRLKEVVIRKIVLEGEGEGSTADPPKDG